MPRLLRLSRLLAHAWRMASADQQARRLGVRAAREGGLLLLLHRAAYHLDYYHCLCELGCAHAMANTAIACSHG